MLYLVTVKLPKNQNHNPRNKVVGDCPIGGGWCTDVTGEHHTTLVESDKTPTELRDKLLAQYHVTRVEELHTTLRV